MMVTLISSASFISESFKQEFVEFQNGAVVLRNRVTGARERYSLKTGKRLGARWDLWRLPTDEIFRLRAMLNEQRGKDVAQ